MSDENGVKTPLPGANIYFSGSKGGTTTNPDGEFSLKKEANTYLIASFIGYIPDSILISDNEPEDIEFILSEGVQLSEALVSANQLGTNISRITPLKTELINKAGLMKMACCNLSESFENSATVTVGFTDAISGAKQVQLLGLSGIYSQMLDENIPTLRGLSSTFGWSYVPGTWLESIQISKGASSVVNGYESVVGQINLEFKKPNNTETFFVNLFMDDANRYEGNITGAAQVGKYLWSGLMLHGSIESKEHDGNDDGFLDMPKSKMINLYNRWFYLNPEKRIESRTGIKLLYEKREGGQLSDFSDRFQTNIENKHFSIYNKTGFYVGSKEGQSIGIINSFTRHELDSEFGMKDFKGTQNTFYSNILFTSFINNTSHQYTTGISFTYDQYEKAYQDRLSYNNIPYTQLNRDEIVPGAFVQYTYSYLEKFVFILGMRTDYNSKYGWLFTPRTNIKYNITDDIILRGSAGRGYRSPNVIADNIGLMASSRRFELDGIREIDIEQAWNYGGNITFYIPIWSDRKLTLSMDYFHTRFQNQAVVDIERDRNRVFFYNLQGSSYANVWQTDMSFTLLRGLDLFAAFRYNRTWMTLTQNDLHYKVEKPLTSRYRGLLNLSYATNFKKWVFDVTAQINGPSRLPSLSGYDTPADESPWFPVYFAQITKNTKRFDIYLGIENIFNYKQDDPIIDHQNPFGPDFDSSMIWGPLMGRKIYAGIRLRIGKF
jgi:outer membrane receptor for ferrienterochelin and colicin